MFKPVLNVPDVRVSDDGELPRGIYFYILTEVNKDTESFVNIMQVIAPHRGNSIHIFWNPIVGKSEYRLYRGQNNNLFDGYFTVYGDDGYFCDNGDGILNAQKLNLYGID